MGLLLALSARPLPAADFTKVEVPGLPAVASLSPNALAWGDYDNDGLLDFLLTGSSVTQLWRNTGTGFGHIPLPGVPGIGEGSVDWGDFDNDGLLDFLLCGFAGSSNSTVTQLWRNTGNSFVQKLVPGLPGTWLGEAAWGDFDNDGRLDFLLTGTRTFSAGPRVAQLWRNTGATFVQVTVPGLTGVENSAVAWGDYDDDGWLDFLIMGTTLSAFSGGNPNQAAAAVTQLWRNTGNGFVLVPIPGLTRSYGGQMAWGDYDNDGRMDFIITGQAGTQLWRNTASGFTLIPTPGIGSQLGTVAWADYNNDGWLDLAAGTLLWRNLGGTFESDPVENLPVNGVPSFAWADWDNDGLVDFLTSGFDGFAEPGDQYFTELWRNTGATANAAPAAPTGLSATTIAGVTTLRWNPGTDDHTPAGSLGYNLRVGTQPGAADIVSAHADSTSGFRRLAAPGNAGPGLLAILRLPPGKFYVSVQALDASWIGGPFSAPTDFTTATTLEIGRHGVDIFLTWSTAEPGFVLESSISLQADSWIPEPPGTGSPLPLRLEQPTRFFRLRRP